MYALRERRVHVTQEDFEMAVAKVCVHLGPFYVYVLSDSCPIKLLVFNR